MNRAQIDIPKDEIAAFCRTRHIAKLALFGSVLREDFRADSDVDVLVQFEPDHVPGFIALAQMEEELSALLGGRKVDLVTEKFLNRRIRQEILEQSEVEYVLDDKFVSPDNHNSPIGPHWRNVKCQTG